MSPDELKVRARRIAEELLTQGDLSVADEIFAPDCHHHTPHPLAPGAAGVKGWVAVLRRAFPDLCAIVEDEVAEGDQVVQRLSLAGIQDASFCGVAARRRRTTWQAIELLRVGLDGRFTEHWCIWDQRDLLRQLGDVHATEWERQ